MKTRMQHAVLSYMYTDAQKSAPCFVAFLCVFTNQNSAKLGADLCTRV